MERRILFCAAILLLALSSSVGWSRTEETQIPANVGTLSLSVDEGKHWYSHPAPVLGIKSYNDNGRADDYNNPKGRIFKSKNEMYAGVKTEAGWGVFGQIVEYGYNYENTVGNRVVPGDPSVTIMHPTLYDNGIVKIAGQFREYFPVGDFSANRKQYQQAYYSFLAWKLPNRYDFFNVAIPRYFSQQYYAPNDATFYTEDYTTVSKQLNRWLRLGVGQHFQVEVHPVTATGVTIEGYPYADISLSPTVFLGPRIYFPLIVKDYVYDAPSKVSAGQIQAELYVQATL